MRISVLILTAMLAVCNVNGAEVNVYAAASLTDVMKEIASRLREGKWRQNII